MNATTKLQLAKHRARAAKGLRKTLVNERADGIQKSWSLDDNFEDIWRALGIVSALVLALVVGLGLYSFAAISKKAVEASQLREFSAECQSQGRIGYLQRNASGDVLAYRCFDVEDNSPMHTNGGWEEVR